MGAWHLFVILWLHVLVFPEDNPFFFPWQKISVVEQEKIDRVMIELDGTENKCKWGMQKTSPVSPPTPGSEALPPGWAGAHL